MLGPRLPFPHQSAVKAGGGLAGLRPRGGRSPWRALYKTQRRQPRHCGRLSRRGPGGPGEGSSGQSPRHIGGWGGISKLLAELVPNKQVLAKQLADPEVARIWQETEFADQVATMLIDYRARHRLHPECPSASAWVRQPPLARLESGEHTPSFRTLARLAEVLGLDLELRIMRDRFELTAEGHAYGGCPGIAWRPWQS